MKWEYAPEPNSTGVEAVEMTVDAIRWLHKLQVISLGRDNRSRNVDAIMTIEYFVDY